MFRSVELLLALAIPMLGIGCSKSGTPAEASELTSAFQLNSPPVEAKQETASPAAPVQGQDAEVKQVVGQAVSAMRTNAYVEAAALLQVLKTQPNLTPEQRIAVQDASVAVLARVAEAADRGDPAAIKAVEAIKRMPRR